MRKNVNEERAALRGRLLSRWTARAMLLAFVLALGAFGIARQAEVVGADDCGPGGSVTVAPRIFRNDTATSDEPTSADNTYFIETAAHLQWVAEQVNRTTNPETFSGKIISLSADIPLSGVEWVPIGIGENKVFNGTFKGNNHIISNLTIAASDIGSLWEGAGLFGVLVGSVDGVHLRGISIKCEEDYSTSAVGMLAGKAFDSTISNCTVEGTVSAGEGSGLLVAGGLVGVLSGTLKDCHVLSGLVENKFDYSYSYTGGVVGEIMSGATVSGCSFQGTSVSGYIAVGGIVGYVGGDATIDGCVFNSTVSGARVGGIVGEASDGGTLTIKDCLSSGTVSGKGRAVGGILGMGEISEVNQKITVTSCVNDANVTNDIVGEQGTRVIGTGGIAGSILKDAAVSASGQKVEISRVINSGVVTVAVNGTPATLMPISINPVVGLGGIAGVVGGNGSGAIEVMILESANTNVVDFKANGGMDLESGNYHSTSVGGLVGSLGYSTDANALATMKKLYNTKNVSLSDSFSFTGAGTNHGYIGGLIGNAPDANGSNIEYAYNRGNVVDSKAAGRDTSAVGGIVGSAYGFSWNQLYSSALTITGTTRGGIAGEGDSSIYLSSVVYVSNDASLMYAVGDRNSGGGTDVDATRVGLDAMKDSGTYINLDWNDQEVHWEFPSNNLPSLDFSSNSPEGFVVLTPYISITAGGTAKIETIQLPDTALRNPDSSPYEVSGPDFETYFTEGSTTQDNGNLMLRSNGTPGRATVHIYLGSIYHTVTVDITAPPEPVPNPPHITAFDITGVPTEPMLDGASSDLYIEWTDLDGVVHTGGTDQPDPAASVSWDVTVPASGDKEWTVTVTKDASNPLVAKLTVVSAGVPESGQLEYSVTAHVTQSDTGGSSIFDGSKTVGFKVGEPLDPNVKYINSFSVKGDVPTDAVSSDTAFDVYIEWTDTNNAVHSVDMLPNPSPDITWSISAPGGEVWDVTVTEDASNPLKAKVSVSPPDGDTGIRSYSVQAHMAQNDEFDRPRFDNTSSAAFEVGRPLPSDAVIASTFYIRKVPISPAGDGDTYDLYIEWEDADGVVHSSGSELYPRPYIQWSIIEPEDGEWNVSVAQDSSDPFKARLSIAAGDDSSERQQYHVAVFFSQIGGIDGELYKRAFYVGDPFLTAPVLSQEQQDEIDRVNAILARTDVMITPGNRQRAIPEHILNMLSDILRNLLEPDISTYDKGRGAGDPPIYVLSDLQLIEDLRIDVESPDIPSIPYCFVCTDKESANIQLGLSPLYDSAPRLPVNTVVIVPMSYIVRIQSDDMRDFYGEGLARDIVADPNAHLDEIFEVIVLHKRIKEGVMKEWYTRLVNGVAKPAQAVRNGMLKLTGDTTDGSLLIDMSYYVVDYWGESFVVESTANADGSGGPLGYFFLPDGLPNRHLIDPLWLNLWTRDSGPTGGGGGGGGCATGAAIPLLIALALGLAYRSKKK